MAQLEETHCCGIRELNGVQSASRSAEQLLEEAARDWFEEDVDGAFIFWSTANHSILQVRGAEIATYIEKHKMGKVHKTSSMRNPNSEHMLTMWIWEVNKSAFKKFWKAHYIKDDDDDF